MTDRELRMQIEDALNREPGIDRSRVRVSVDGGVVALHGDIGSYIEKSVAERTVVRVYGVKAVANDLAVRPLFGYQRNDSEIAEPPLFPPARRRSLRRIW